MPKQKKPTSFTIVEESTSTIRSDDISFSTTTSLLTNKNNQLFQSKQTKMELSDDVPNKRFITDCFLKKNAETAAIYRDIYPNLQIKVIESSDDVSVTAGIRVELPPGKPLSEILVDGEEFSFDNWLEITRQCIAQVCSFHNGKLSHTGKEYTAHRQINPDNIYVDHSRNPETNEMQIKVYLTGFHVEMSDVVNAERLKQTGISNKASRQLADVNIPSELFSLSSYRAPENRLNISGSFQQDIYAVGILMLGFYPQKKHLFKKAHHTAPSMPGLLSNIKEDTREINPSSAEKYDKFWNVALRMASRNPKDRPSVTELETLSASPRLTPAERILKEKMASSKTDEERERWARMSEAIKAVRKGVEAFKQPKQNSFGFVRQSVENIWNRRTIAETQKASEKIIRTTDVKTLEEELPFFIQQLNKQCPLGKNLVSAIDIFQTSSEKTKNFSDISSEKTDLTEEEHQIVYS